MGVTLGRVVGRKNDFVGAQRVRQARQRHLLPEIQGAEERFKLRLIRMIGDIARVEQLQGQLAPFAFVQSTQLRGIKLVVQQTAFTPDQVNVEIVWLKTIDDRSDFSHSAVLELQNGDAGRRILILGEVAVDGVGG